jgi:leucyl aminopeptidase
MTENSSHTASHIRLAAQSDQNWQPKLVAEYQFAPQAPTPGLPGKNPGDIIVVQEKTNQKVIVSLGERARFSLEVVRQASGLLGRWLTSSGAIDLGLDLDTLQAAAPDQARDDLAQAALTGLGLGAYQFKRYKKNGDLPEPPLVGLLSGGKPWIDTALSQRVDALISAVWMARDLSHEPANVINPPSLASHAQAVASQSGLKITVLDENQLAAMGAGAILAVGRGSRTPPRMIILEYPGNSAGQQPVALVGKAITFDSGGYYVKSVDGMVGMKYDKCGGVDVLAIMQAAAALHLDRPLVGVICAAENMISSESYRPDDIVTALNGKTIEIVSTDAEGRLVLADGLVYAQRQYQPRAIIDLATLTGGVVNALGHVRAGLMSNNDDLAAQLYAAGERTGERLWRLPLDEEFSNVMKGDDADLRNSGGREGHAILGGAFLKEFIADDTPWAHLDIAGVADLTKDTPYAPKGATGFGIRLIIDYLQTL